MIDTAILLCAGKGSRLGRLTRARPKALLEFAGATAIEWQLWWLVHWGIRNVLINLHHCGDQIPRALGGRYRGIAIDYLQEETLLGTAGTVRRWSLESPAAILLGDILTTFDLSAMIRDYAGGVALATHRPENPWDSGVIDVRAGRVAGFREKPADAQPGAICWAGIAIAGPEEIRLIPDMPTPDISRDWFPALLAAGVPFSLHPVEPSYLVDFGTPAGLGHALVGWPPETT